MVALAESVREQTPRTMITAAMENSLTRGVYNQVFNPAPKSEVPQVPD